jgi:glucose-specific phosphotransferase system IIA component
VSAPASGGEPTPRVEGAADTVAEATTGSVAVLAPVPGRAVALEEVPDPIFAGAMVGPGAAIDPPREVLDAIAPVSGTLVKVFPHAFVILSTEGVGVLVHLGLDTVELGGEGFTLHVRQGAEVAAGDVVVTYDVPAIEAAGLNPIVPVVVLERTADHLVLGDAVATRAELPAGGSLLTVTLG